MSTGKEILSTSTRPSTVDGKAADLLYRCRAPMGWVVGEPLFGGTKFIVQLSANSSLKGGVKTKVG